MAEVHKAIRAGEPLPEAAGTWADDTLVCSDKSIMTVFPDGSVEVRGPGWEPRRNSKRARSYQRGFDCRILKLGTVEKARRICESVALIVAGYELV